MLILATAILLMQTPETATDDRPAVVVAVGASGDPEYDADFHRTVDAWRAAAEKAPADFHVVGLDPESSAEPDRDQLRKALEATPTVGREALWLVLIGHGTFDGREAKFNLRGPDLSANELADWLRPFNRPLAIVNGASASGPFLTALSAPGRIVIAATRSGDEQNYARFGPFLAQSIAAPEADLDKDGQVSLLEAFLHAGSRTEEFYRSNARLATEHALIDDDGDARGTPAGWFKGLRSTKKPAGGKALDGSNARRLHLVPNDRDRRLSPEARDRRDQLERDAETLRTEKQELGEDAYYQRLEAIMVELARLYRDAPSP